jgi:hypothetical protein
LQLTNNPDEYLPNITNTLLSLLDTGLSTFSFQSLPGPNDMVNESTSANRSYLPADGTVLWS